MNKKNIVWHSGYVSKEDRQKILGYKNKVLWFTGLSGSGKSTIAHLLEKELFKKKILSFVLDGDNIRHGLNSDLGFSEEDRKENIRRIKEVTKLFYDSGIYTLVCFISPFRKDRDDVRKLIGEDFVEIFVKCSLDECEKRDAKGLYKKARAGKIQDFTGLSQKYEEPTNPEIVLDSEKLSVEECVSKIMNFLNIK